MSPADRPEDQIAASKENLMKSETEHLLRVLIQEAEGVRDAIRATFLFSERVIALGVTILGVGATVGVARNVEEVLVALPFGVLSLIGYGVHLGTELLYLGGYRQYLEESLNRILGDEVLVWETTIVPRYRRFPNIDGLILVWTLTASLITTGVLGYQAAVELGPLWVVGLSGLLLVSGLLVLVAMIRMKGAPERAYQLAKRKN